MPGPRGPTSRLSSWAHSLAGCNLVGYARISGPCGFCAPPRTRASYHPRMRTVFLDYQTVSNGDLDPAALERAAGDLRFYPVTSDSEIAERIANIEVVL